ncbi:MAG: TonB-dependent receptor [Cryomorphaceae bacterium]|nr:TonB-dependent receptor [Cryomorphaceae bacterium]
MRVFGVIVFSISSVFYGQIQAQSVEQDSAKLVELAPATIFDKQTGLADDTPYQIERVSLQPIEFRSNPSGVMGQLRQIPGVNGAEMGHGIVKPFIRGLGFSRVVTIYQGNKLENHQWGADHGLGISDLGVNNVQIIKGPASILYGSGAVGGVLVLEDDERIFSKNYFSGNAGMSYNSVSGGYRPYFNLGRKWENGFFLGADAAIERHADYLDGSGRIIGNSRFSTDQFRVHTGFTKNNFRGKLSYTYLRQQLGIIEDDEMDESLATERYDYQMQLPFQDVTDHLISYNQVAKLGDWNTTFHLSHHINDRNEIEDDFDEIDLGLVQSHTFWNFRMRKAAGKNFFHTVGLQGTYLHNRNKRNAEEILIPDARLFENAIFYLGTWERKKWTFEFGARYDYRNVVADASQPHLIDYGFTLAGNPDDRKLNRDFHGPTGSLGLSRRIGSNQQVKANVSSGFRAPDLSELFSNGPHPGTNRFEVGNASFDREQSLQFDLAYQYQKDPLTFTASPFVNMVQNYIYFAASGNTTPDGLNIWNFLQEDAYLFGGELQVKYEPIEGLCIGAQSSWVRGRFRDANLTFIPADNYQLDLRYSPWKKRKSSVFASVRYIDDQNRPGLGEEVTPSYTLVNFGLSHTVSLKKSELHFGLTLYNAFNQLYIDHMSILRAFNVPSVGRNLMINVQYAF